MHEREWFVYYCLSYFMVGNPQLLHMEGLKKNTAGCHMTANFAL
jgi:hypothetical protein